VVSAIINEVKEIMRWNNTKMTDVVGNHTTQIINHSSYYLDFSLYMYSSHHENKLFNLRLFECAIFYLFLFVKYVWNFFNIINCVKNLDVNLSMLSDKNNKIEEYTIKKFTNSLI